MLTTRRERHRPPLKPILNSIPLHRQFNNLQPLHLLSSHITEIHPIIQSQRARANRSAPRKVKLRVSWRNKRVLRLHQRSKTHRRARRRSKCSMISHSRLSSSHKVSSAVRLRNQYQFIKLVGSEARLRLAHEAIHDQKRPRGILKSQLQIPLSWSMRKMLRLKMVRIFGGQPITKDKRVVNNNSLSASANRTLRETR